jgi:nicotinamidase/pyrazinamidase
MDGAIRDGALRRGDVLLIVDVQNDFVSGSLAVPGGGEVIAPLNAWIRAFEHLGLPVVATRDWHPGDHCSFVEQGGQWPPHCVGGTEGAAFAKALKLPAGTWLVSKATRPDREAYSGFEGTDLDRRLRQQQAKRLFVGGLATDYCVLRTVLDARSRGYETYVIADAIRAVNVKPGDGEQAQDEIIRAGASFVTLEDFLDEARAGG